MILGKVQSKIGMKECRMRRVCYECGLDGFPSCDLHRDVFMARQDRKRVKDIREQSDGVCSLCEFDFREVERKMKKASGIMIAKLVYGNLKSFIGTGLPIDISRVTKIGKRVVLKKHGLEKYAHHDRISTITIDDEMVCIKCL